MIYKTKCGKTIDTDGINKIEFLSEVPQPLHWGWFIACLIIFWPTVFILMIMAYFNKVFLCKINDVDIVRMDKEIYSQIVSRLKIKDENVSESSSETL